VEVRVSRKFLGVTTTKKIVNILQHIGLIKEVKGEDYF